MQISDGNTNYPISYAIRANKAIVNVRKQAIND